MMAMAESGQFRKGSTGIYTSPPPPDWRWATSPKINVDTQNDACKSL